MLRIRVPALLFLLAVSASFVRAQSEIVPTISELLQSHSFEAAEKKLDEFAKQYPKSADVPMMRGNVVWLRFSSGNPGIELRANSDESIFESSVGSIEEPTVVVPDSVATAVASYWQRALELEPARRDIHMGLCTIYSFALMEPKVERQLDALLRQPGADSVSPYDLATYARHMIDRDDLADGIRLYRYIVGRFPRERSGLLSDIAAQYQLHDSIDLAMRYIDSALSQGTPDDFVYGNALQFHCWNLRTDLALRDITELSKLQNNRHDRFFSALLEYLQGKSSWRESMTAYLRRPSDSDGEEETLARVLLRTGDEHDILLAAIDSTSHASYAILLANHGIERYPTDRRFYHRFAYEEGFCGNYARAREAIDRATAQKATDPAAADDEWDVLRAWVLQRTGSEDQARPLWKRLATSKNDYVAAAGAYFYSKSLIAEHKTSEATPILKAAIDRDNNKYTMLCKWLLDRME